MKHVIVLIITIYSINVYGYKIDKCSYKADTIEKSIQNMIDSVKEISKDSNAKEVFIAKFYHLDWDKKDISFTVGYIMNSKELNRIDASYYFTIGKEIILIEADNDFIKQLKRLNLIKIDSVNKAEIIQKLFDNNIVYVTYRPCGMVFTIRKCTVIKSKFYESAWDMPNGISIYAPYPTGIIKKINPPDSTNEHFH